MRVFSRDLGKYCTVVSMTQLKEAKESGIPEAKIEVETHMNIYGQGEKPFFRKLGVTEVKYSELKF
jgi:hypothetical protein